MRSSSHHLGQARVSFSRWFQGRLTASASVSMAEHHDHQATPRWATRTPGKRCRGGGKVPGVLRTTQQVAEARVEQQARPHPGIGAAQHRARWMLARIPPSRMRSRLLWGWSDSRHRKRRGLPCGSASTAWDQLVSKQRRTRMPAIVTVASLDFGHDWYRPDRLPCSSFRTSINGSPVGRQRQQSSASPGKRTCACAWASMEPASAR